MSKRKQLLLSFRESVPLQEKGLGIYYTLFLLIFSAAVITVCSKSSPLYPLNTWDDANCFFTVGKSVANGQIMYKDIFEQKGPLLYFIYAAAYTVSANSFLGAYLIEIITAFVFLYFCARIIMLLCDKRAVLLLPLAAIAIYAAPTFEQGGSAEELCLPMIAYGLFVGLRSIITDKPVSRFDWLMVGITSGAVLWIKFSLLGFYLGCGIFMVFFYIKRKWQKELINFFIFLILGEFITALPILFYFIVNDAADELFEVYFYCNIFIYPVREVENRFLGLILNIHEGTKSCLYSFGAGCGIIISGLVYAFIRSKRMFVFVISSLVTSYLLIYAGGRRYTYYSLILAAFIPLGVVMAYRLLCLVPLPSFRWAKKTACALSSVSVMISLGLIYYISPNTYMMSYSRHQLPQYSFGEIISQTDRATLLNYKFLDGGFYTAGEVLPNCRFFCGLNIPYALDEQDSYVEAGLVDYVITCNRQYYFNNYELVCSQSFEAHENSYNTYYLYKRTYPELL